LAQVKGQLQEASDRDPHLYPPLRVLLEPQQQMIGENVYEVAFIADTDGLPLEFIRRLERLSDF
jgi:hypothetical protein